jgi:2-oxoacid:acceptor oxidoreductase gamma subunit (pyruvate/2-ketoisovalerate family)
MLNIRFHGRGGQGIVTSADILAVAAANDGKYAQAMPAFGPERTLAPVTSFCRIDTKPIVVYQEIYHPDIVVVLDPSLLSVVDVLKGLQPGGTVIINSKPSDFKCTDCKMHFIDARPIAMKVMGKPFVNTVILGALARISGVVSSKSLKDAILHRFPGEGGEKNAEAAQACYDSCPI